MQSFRLTNFFNLRKLETDYKAKVKRISNHAFLKIFNETQMALCTNTHMYKCNKSHLYNDYELNIKIRAH